MTLTEAEREYYTELEGNLDWMRGVTNWIDLRILTEIATRGPLGTEDVRSVVTSSDVYLRLKALRNNSYLVTHKSGRKKLWVITAAGRHTLMDAIDRMEWFRWRVSIRPTVSNPPAFPLGTLRYALLKKRGHRELG